MKGNEKKINDLNFFSRKIHLWCQFQCSKYTSPYLKFAVLDLSDVARKRTFELLLYHNELCIK